MWFPARGNPRLPVNRPTAILGGVTGYDVISMLSVIGRSQVSHLDLVGEKFESHTFAAARAHDYELDQADPKPPGALKL